MIGRTMVTARSLRALDWLNFFVANVQTGFGPFIASYLASHKWTQGEIGMALSVGTISAMVSQVPGGAAVDALRNKKGAAAWAIFAIIFSAVLLAASPTVLPVIAAEVFHGFASCMLTPALAAISFALVGRANLGDRLGRRGRVDGRIRRILFPARGVLADRGAGRSCAVCADDDPAHRHDRAAEGWADA
jgi:MFS family permease